MRFYLIRFYIFRQIKEKIMKKGLVGLAIIAVLGGGYFGYSQYQDYQKREYARLLQERNQSIRKMIEENRQDAINRKVEEEARLERIAKGEGKVEKIVTYYDTGEKKEEYVLLEGRKEGKYIRWHKSGLISSEATYKNGFLVGERKVYFDNSQHTMNAISQYDRTDENRSFGEHNTQWYINGNKREESYQNDQFPEKEYKKYWREDGTLEIELFFDPDLNLTVVIGYYPSGEVEYKYLEDRFKDKQQKATYWYKSGKKYFEANYKDRFIHGIATYWYESGQKYAEIVFDDFGYANGWCQQWDENGVLIRKAFLENGKEKFQDGTIKYDPYVKCQKVPPLKGFDQL